MPTKKQLREDVEHLTAKNRVLREAAEYARQARQLAQVEQRIASERITRLENQLRETNAADTLGCAECETLTAELTEARRTIEIRDAHITADTGAREHFHRNLLDLGLIPQKYINESIPDTIDTRTLAQDAELVRTALDIRQGEALISQGYCRDVA